MISLKKPLKSALALPLFCMLKLGILKMNLSKVVKFNENIHSCTQV